MGKNKTTPAKQARQAARIEKLAAHKAENENAMDVESHNENNPDTSMISADPTLPNLYEARLAPGGGITLAGDEGDKDVEPQRAKKRRKSHGPSGAKDEAHFAMPADKEPALTLIEGDEALPDLKMKDQEKLEKLATAAAKKRKREEHSNFIDRIVDISPQYKHLLKPWELIDSNARKAVEYNFGPDIWNNVRPIWLQKNTIVQRTVDKILGYVHPVKYREEEESLPWNSLRSPRLIVPVSGQGKETHKVLSAVHVALEELKPNPQTNWETWTWYMYHTLGQWTPEAPVNEEADKAPEEGGDENESEVDFESMDQVKGSDKTTDDVPSKKKPEPVLTVWLSKWQIPEFAEVFGEKSFEIAKPFKTDAEGNLILPPLPPKPQKQLSEARKQKNREKRKKKYSVDESAGKDATKAAALVDVDMEGTEEVATKVQRDNQRVAKKKRARSQGYKGKAAVGEKTV